MYHRVKCLSSGSLWPWLSDLFTRHADSSIVQHQFSDVGPRPLSCCTIPRSLHLPRVAFAVLHQLRRAVLRDAHEGTARRVELLVTKGIGFLSVLKVFRPLTPPFLVLTLPIAGIIVRLQPRPALAG